MRRELRLLRVQHANYKRWRLLQKQKTDRLEKVVEGQNQVITKLEQEINRLRQEKQDLVNQLDKTKKERDTYKDMIFKAKRARVSSGRSRGGQPGHPGHARPGSLTVDWHIRAFLIHCPDCHTRLPRTAATDTYTVIDLPHWKDVRPISI